MSSPKTLVKSVASGRAPFTVQDAPSGQVLADASGHTVYIYRCNDDAWDQLTCDHPSTPQDYRFAVCGGGDPSRCMKTFPFVVAAKDARLIRTALAHNQDVLIAAARIEQAEAQLGITRADQLPAVAVGVAGGREHFPASVSGPQ